MGNGTQESGSRPGKVTWHWGEGFALVHAVLQGEEKALCGERLESPPVMRPPLVEARCTHCQAASEGMASVYPNLHRPVSLGPWGEDD